MTQAENSAARIEQIEVLIEHFSTAGFPPFPARKLAEDTVAEAEARGAAEQRRKDAEGQEPVAWVDAQDLPSEECQRRPAHLILKRTAIYSTPLYDHPANVAALEARVKVLEEENEKFRNALFYIDETAKGFWDPKGHKDCIEIARAALTREGGE